MFGQVVAIAVLTMFVTCVWRVWERRKRPPGPWSLPIVGYLPWLDPQKPYVTLTTLSRKYGPVYGIWMGSVYTVVLADHKIIRRTLVKDVFSGRAPLYVTHGIMKGYGIICSEGEMWKDQRKFVYSCLRNFGAVKNSPKREKIQELIKSGVDELLQYLQEKSNPEISIDLLPTLRHCVGNVMNALVFGVTWSSEDAMWNWLQILQEEGTKHIGVSGPLNFLPLLRFLPKYSRTMRFLLEGKEKTHKVYKSLIDEHETAMNGNTEFECKNIIDAFLVEREKRKALEDVSATFYSDQQFFHLLADIFGAGLDTTLTTLRWFFLFMAAFPDEQTRVHEELDAVLSGNFPTIDDMAALPFTEAAIAETQRIRSVVPVGIPHGTLEGTQIEGFEVPKGTMVVPLQWAVHMDPMYWLNPELYNPGRFLDAEGKFFRPDYFIPYQTGKRMCVGDELARILLFLFGASVIQQFRISCPIDAEIDLTGDCGITLTPKKHNLVFTPRHNNHH